MPGFLIYSTFGSKCRGSTSGRHCESALAGQWLAQFPCTHVGACVASSAPSCQGSLAKWRCPTNGPMFMSAACTFNELHPRVTLSGVSTTQQRSLSRHICASSFAHEHLSAGRRGLYKFTCMLAHGVAVGSCVCAKENVWAVLSDAECLSRDADPAFFQCVFCAVDGGFCQLARLMQS